MNLRTKRGFVLVCVMWILALLTVVALSFSRRAMMEHRAAAYSIDRTQALYMARGAVTRGIVEVRNKATVDRMQGMEGHTGFDQRWADPPDLLNDENYYSLSGTEETEDEECFYVIEDAERYISINAAPSDVLEEIPSLSLRAVTQITRRRDSASRERRSMAFLTVNEIRSLPGIDETVWDGTEEIPGLRDLITVYGDGRINLNTCSFAVLQMVPNLSDEAKEKLRNHLKMPDVSPRDGQAPGGRGTLRNFDELYVSKVLEPSDISILQRYCKLDSSFFTITGFATQRQGRIRARITAAVQNLGDRTEILAWQEEVVGF